MSTRTSPATHTLSLSATDLFRHIVALGGSYACYRLPNTQQFTVLIQWQEGLQRGKIEIENAASGFYMSPFLNEGLEASYFLKADVILHATTEAEALTFSLSEEQQEALGRIDPAKQTGSTHYAASGKIEKDTTQEAYQHLVEEGIAAIKAGRMQKIVPSRTKKVALAQPFALAENLLRLAKAYPNAMITCFSSPETGTWVAATPETLVETYQDTFKTVALAGTQAKKEGQDLSDTQWTQKEIEEQALVSRYIINSFKKIRLREFDEYGPKTVVAGNLLHLKTFFSVNMRETNFPNLGSTMLELLHPTSAVCGMPRQEALDFIRTHETHNRAFYSGFAGPVQVNRLSHLFVLLRCMQVSSDGLILYAGAGVTENSHPQKEWLETELKCDTLLRIIKY
ncbi:chorismate-binding protein [Cytophagales bacterium LB-30]|uniref:Chorismate-binding protein n=1 Tax=Shiella aurantiaca TaxID=3058365 RepID=A0ABT8F555_9BACT|nr:chorismate-binding protein [Shiella aurantiaca]MDN4165356.1 chorismate-binding protein [Shiella aurantiaca]